MMKAIVMTQTGGPEVLQLQDIAEPQIEKPNQIKVKLKAAGINPVDTKIRQRGLFYGAQPPFILGCDGAGEIIAIGDEVSRFQVGDQVYFCHGGLGREPGNYAEYTVLEESRAEFMPARISMAEAGAAPLVLITAWEALYDRANIQAGQTVLIQAGAGGVGHVAIQLAKLRGARVLTTVSSEQKADFCRRLGADECIIYTQQDVAEAVADLTAGEGVDMVLDTVGGEVFAQSIPLLKEYGHLNTLLDPGPALQTKAARNKNLTLSFTLMLTPALKDLDEALAHQGQILRLCAEWLNEGKLQIQLQQVFALEEAAQAHALIEQGHAQGKLVLTP